MPNCDHYRVLGRVGARELTQQEVENVRGGGGLETLTLCSFLPPDFVDGDVGEC